MKKKLFFLFAFILGYSSLVDAQTTFGLKLSELSNDGSNYVVKIEIQMNGADPAVFKLGSSTLQFNFPSNALSNPVAISIDPLVGPYYITPFASVPATGICSYNIELAAANFGVDIAEAPAWTEIGQISFTIDDASQLVGLTWLYTGGTTSTVVYLDDEATQIFAEMPESSNLLFVPLAPAPIDDCTELLISEYGEPNGGNGKYIELYNSSSSTIDLAEYEIWKIGNGGSWPESTLALSGSILSGGTFVIANNDVDVPGANLTNSGIINFNGNDAMGLAKNGVLIDAVGQDGANPGGGFEVAGIPDGTKNHTLVRKNTVLAPNADWVTTAGTNAADSQWQVITYSTTNVGLHTTSCVAATTDADGDGVDDDQDNCISVPNPNQEDLDQDGIGDVCDSDMDGDGVMNNDDCAPMDATIYPGASCDDGDMNTVNDVIQNDCSCAGNIPVPACSELFISEYGEPSGGNGKYIEIYNASNATVDLTSYAIWKIGNGGTWPETYLNLSGTLAPNETYVVANNANDVPGANIYESFIINFNGDDAIGLAKDSVLIDAVGQDGPDPGAGFDVAGVSDGTKDHTLIRKVYVQSPDISWAASAGTDSISSEWLVVPYTQSNLGTHSSSCFLSSDTDQDGIADDQDNCPNTANPNQEDLDMDGIGDVCDTDIDGDGVDNVNDCDPYDASVNQPTSSSFVLSPFTCGTGAQVFDLIPTAGGSFAFNPMPSDGATISMNSGLISNGVPGAIYTVVYTPTSSCFLPSTQTVTMPIDTVAPVFDSIILDETWECDQEIPVPMTPIASDNCDQDVMVAYTDNTITEGCTQTITRTWTATDASGNSSSVDQTIVISDSTSPLFNDYQTQMEVACDNYNQSFVTATDNCSETTITYTDEAMADATCYGQIIRTYTATDACGNSTIATQILILVDTVNPEFTNFPENIILNCGSDIPAIPVVAGVDNCDDSPTIVFDGETSEGTCPMTIVRTWTITDCSGNSVTTSQTISFVDTSAITLTSSPADLTVACDQEITVEFPVATTTAQCGDVSFSYSDDVNVIDACETVITRTFVGEDACGNLVQVIQTITVLDNVAPAFDVYPLTIEAPCDDIPEIVVTATDNCSSVVIEYIDEYLTGGCAGMIERTYFAIDECGNTTTSQQIINLTDTTAPTFDTFPVDIQLTCGDAVPDVDTPTGSDNCSDVVITYEGEQVMGECPMTIIRIWNIVDECGNSFTQNQTITFTGGILPEFSFVPEDITIDCDQEIPNDIALAFTNNPCGNVVVTSSDEENSEGCGYVITRTFTATDACGNASVAIQTITVMDLTAPTLLTTPSDITVSCDSDIPLAEMPTAEDNCDNVLNIVLAEDVSGSCPKSIVRTWTITDDCGNTTITSQTITVNDTTDPEFSSFPEDQNLSCENEVPAVETPTATDNCASEVSLTMTEETTGSCPQDMTITRTWTAVDQCGNEITQTQTITFSSIDAIGELSSLELTISVSPVPVSKDLNLSIQANLNEQASITIYNAIGQEILKKDTRIKMGENTFSFDVSSYQNGMYFIKVVGKTSHEVVSFIKN